MTAVTTQVPESLLEQLMIRGRIVYPKGSRRQNLCVIEHTPQGFIETILDEVKFVPILSGVISK
jgi:protein-L-isoaspartate(D-aspartate) O-methyltransferase